MSENDIIIHFDTEGYSVEPGDQIIVDGDHVLVKTVNETEDPDEILITGESFNEGDTVTYSLLADDLYSVWSI